MTPRRSQQRRRDEKRADRLREAGVAERLQGRYVPPPRETCEQRPLGFRGFEHDRLRYVVLTWRQAGRIVDFQITARCLVDGDWLNVIEVDCRHGHVHYHVTLPGQPRGEAVHIHTLDTQVDVRDGLGIATAVVAHLVMQVFDEWQEVEP